MRVNIHPGDSRGEVQTQCFREFYARCEPCLGCNFDALLKQKRVGIAAR